MALRPFNSIAGISVGNDPQTTVILANGDITTTNLTANGISDLGAVGNVKITGGTNGQFITTDGTGNLSFADATGGNSAAPMPYYIDVGQTYNVPTNFQGLFSQPITIDGTFEIDGILVQVTDTFNASNGQVLFDSNGTVTGNTGFSFDAGSGNLTVPGGATFSGKLLPSSNITHDLGSPTQRWRDIYLANNTIYIGNSTISTADGNLVLTNSEGGQIAVTGNSTATTDSIDNGTSNVIVNATTVNFSANGVADTLVVTDIGISTDSIKTNNYYYANGAPLDMAGSPAGSNTQIQFNNQNEFGASSNLTFNSATNLLTVTGNIAASNANLGNVVTANYLVSNSGCVTLGSGTIGVIGTQGGVFASTITDINIGLAANIVMGSSSGNVTVQGNLTANGKVTGTTLTGTLTTGAQPNITSTGTLTNLTVSGNVNTGNITVTNTVDAVNVKVTDLFSKRTSINISTQTPIDTFPVSSFRSAKYTMRAGDGTDYQALEVLLVHNNINSIITVYGSLSTSGTDLVVFDSDISAGNVNVYATAVGPNTNLNLMGTYVPD